MHKVAIVTGWTSSHYGFKRHLKKLEKYVISRGDEVVKIIRVAGSGSKGESSTEVSKRLMEMAMYGDIDKVLVDHISIRKPTILINTMEFLHSYDISIIPIEIIRRFNIYTRKNKENSESRIEVSELETLDQNGKLTEVGISIIKELRKVFRNSTSSSASIRSGMLQAKKNGKHIGRPKGTFKDGATFLKEYEKVIKFLNEGYSIRKTAAFFQLSPSTVHNIKKKLKV